MFACVTVVCSLVVVVNCNAGQQQAITYNNRLMRNQGYDFQSFFMVGSEVQFHLVDETPAPILARLERAHDRVVGLMEMLGSVLILR